MNRKMINEKRGNPNRGQLSIERVASIAEAELKADWPVGNPGHEK